MLKKCFNPLNASHWYHTSHKEIMKGGGRSILPFYSGSLIEALTTLYPELMLKKENFSIEGRKSRNFFDGFARSQNFNPLDAENWYSVTCNEVVRAGGWGLLRYYNGSHIKALVTLYPELTLKKENFFRSKKGWKALGNQRKFFDTFAESKNFNPLDAENWYSITYNEIVRAGGNGLLGYYNGSHIKALLTLYPELILKRANFFQSEQGWKARGNQRKFFDGFARSKNFNPLEAESWYSVTHKEIIQAGGRGTLHYYNHSHINALLELYPELMLKKENFLQSKGRWKALGKQRKFLDRFAKSKRFNPLDAEKWHSVTHNELKRAVSC